MSSIHGAVSITDVEEKPHFLSAIHTICPIDVFAVLEMLHMHFYDNAEGSLSFRAGPLSPFGLDDSFGPFIDTQYRGLEEHHRAVCEAWARDSASLEVSHALILSDLSSLVDDWLSLLAGTQASERLAVAERIALLFCVLRILPSGATRQAAENVGPNLTLTWVKTLEEAHRKLSPYKAAYQDGLVSMCVEMCRLLGPINFEREQGEQYGIHIDTESLFDFKHSGGQTFWGRECNLVSTWTILAVDIYHDIDHYADENGRHLFVTSVSRVFETMRLRIKSPLLVPVIDDNEMITPMAELLSCMVDTLRWSLVHSHPNCGAYIALPWIKDILQCFDVARDSGWSLHKEPLSAVPLTGDKALQPNFLLVLRLLQACIERNLLAGKTTRKDLKQLLELLKHPELPDLPKDFQVTLLAQRLMNEGKPGCTISELPDDMIPNWLWTLGESSTPADLSGDRPTTPLENARPSDPNPTVNYPYHTLQLVPLPMSSQSHASVHDDDGDRLNSKTWDDGVYPIVNGRDGGAPPQDCALPKSSSALSLDGQHQEDAIISFALLGLPSAPETTMHTDLEMPSPEEVDGHLSESHVTFPAPLITPWAIGDPWSRSMEVNALECERAHDGAQTSTIGAQSTNPHDMITITARKANNRRPRKGEKNLEDGISFLSLL